MIKGFVCSIKMRALFFVPFHFNDQLNLLFGMNIRVDLADAAFENVLPTHVEKCGKDEVLIGRDVTQ
jgi:hypothetical protein